MAEGTKDDPWVLRTPPGTSEYTLYREGDELICQVGSTRLTYHARAVDDLHSWLRAQGDWVPLGAADEQKTAAAGTVEARGRSETNPVGGWYGTRKGYRGRFGMYLPPLLEELGLAELTHDARNNRIRGVNPGASGPLREGLLGSPLLPSRAHVRGAPRRHSGPRPRADRRTHARRRGGVRRARARPRHRRGGRRPHAPVRRPVGDAVGEHAGDVTGSKTTSPRRAARRA